ncbi:hypothetical protein KDK88_09255 [bacterium]|nr:hypothetical protein [bacterium]
MPRRTVLSAVLLLLLTTATAAAAVPLTFQVRMGYQITLGAFDPAADTVDVAGSFNGWGTAPLTPLADADGDSVWSVTVDGFTPGETIEYKFRYNGVWDGREEFPGVGNNRTFTVQPDGNAIDVWFGDLEPGGVHGGAGELFWWNDAVFYEVFVRSFQDGDGDGIGDLQGLTARLDDLNDGDPATHDDLGVTALWLMPVNDAASYHGYDAVDYRAVHPDYGTLQDFRDFLDAAHARGIRVIVDYVMNHCSTQHPWFQAAAAGDPTYRDRFRWSAADPGQWGPWGQPVWHAHASGWYYGLFWSGMPDLNYDDPAVRDEMFDTAAWWLDEVGVDGFRLDAVLYIKEEGDQLQDTPGTLQFWHDFEAATEAVRPGSLTLGEAWTSTSVVQQYTADDRLDLCFEFDLAGSMLGAVQGGDATDLAGKAALVYDQYPFLQFATFLTNHDQDRVYEVLGRDEGRARAAAGLLLTLPGVPFLYYGEEIGLDGSGDHLNIRRPMPWDGTAQGGFTVGTPWQPLAADYPSRNVALQSQDPGSLLSRYRTLIRTRLEAPALRRGAYAPLGSSTGQVLAFLRTSAEQTLICLTNVGSTSTTDLRLSGLGGVLPAGEVVLRDLLTDATHTVQVDAAGGITGLELPGHATAVLAPLSVTGTESAPLPRRSSRLEPVVPNPFNPAAEIRYELDAPAHVRLAVFDARGRRTALLLRGRREAGRHAAVWRGVTDDGAPAPAGVYWVRLEAGGETSTTSAVLVR